VNVQEAPPESRMNGTMMRMRCAGVALMIVLFAAGTRAAPADDRASIDAGRAIGRALLVLRDPRACAIALLRARCHADVEAFAGTASDADFAKIPNIGPRPLTGLRAFVDRGDRDGFDRALVYLNSRTADAAAWARDPRSAALFDAGVESVLYHAAGGNMVQQLLGAGALMDLENHAGAIPAGALGVAVPNAASASASAPGVRASGDLTGTADRLVRAIDAAAPALPFASIPARDDAAGLAALGVAGSTVNELVDAPAWLFQPESQAFVDAFTARITAVAPTSADQIAAFRAATRPGTTFSHDVASRGYGVMLAPLPASMHGRFTPYVVGAFAAQMVYNAAILRDPGIARGMLAVVGSNAALDAAVPGWAAARAEASSISATAWSAQYALGVKLVDLIEKAGQS